MTDTKKNLRVADAGMQSITAAAPLVESFPSSAKISLGALEVPARRIELSAGEPALVVYDTSGPKASTRAHGLPKRRAAWISERLAAAATATYRRCTTRGAA